MSKVLKNTTVSDIFVSSMGISLPASSSTTIEVSDYILLATADVVTELTTYINSGDIVVNDGVVDLEAADGITYIGYPDHARSIVFSPTESILATTVQEAVNSGVGTALNTPRFSIPLVYNGTLSNNEFIGYSNLIPGDSTPIVIPIDCVMEEYTFSNSNMADFTIELRKNSTTATVFNSTSKTDTDNFVASGINETFTQGDTIYIKYIDNGTNAQDAGIVLIFRALP